MAMSQLIRAGWRFKILGVQGVWGVRASGFRVCGLMIYRFRCVRLAVCCRGSRLTQPVRGSPCKQHYCLSGYLGVAFFEEGPSTLNP